MGASESSEPTIAAAATAGFALGGIGYGPIMGQRWQDAEQLPQSESGRKNLARSWHSCRIYPAGHWRQ